MRGKDLIVIFILIGLFVSSFKFLSQDVLYDCMDNSCCSLRTIRGGEVNFFGSLGNFGEKTNDIFDYLAYGITKSCGHFMMSCNLIDHSEIRIDRNKLSVFRPVNDNKSLHMACPPIDMRTSSGDYYSLDEFRGQKVALMFVDLRYSSCIDVLLNISKLKETYSERDINIIPVCVNYNVKGVVTHPSVLTEQLQLKYNLSTLDRVDGAIQINPDSRTLTILINENGLITDVLDEESNYSFLAASINRFLN